MTSSKTATQEIVDHYAKYNETERLKHDIGPLELARTRELMLRYLPPVPAVVLDVGGATGVYAFWLVGLGYGAYLVDIVLRHIEQAREAPQAPGAPQLAGMCVGDAQLAGWRRSAGPTPAPRQHPLRRGRREQPIRHAGVHPLLPDGRRGTLHRRQRRLRERARTARMGGVLQLPRR